jgi:hypothetical protein
VTTRTVKPGGGGDYSSLSLWEPDTDNDLVTAAAGELAECYAGSDAISASLTISGATTNSTYYREVRAASGAEAKMPWGSTSDTYVLSTSTAMASLLTVDEDYARVVSIQVDHLSTSTNQTALRLNVVSGPKYAVGCYARSAGTGTTSAAFYATGSTGTVYFINCVATASLMGIRIVRTALAYNCTVVGCATGITREGGTATAKNCLVSDASTACFSGTFGASSVTNASSDATAPGTGSRTSQTFTFVNAAGGDYHLASGDAGAKNFGTDLSADASYAFSTDFDGQTRSGSWDIGADEYIAAGGSLPIFGASRTRFYSKRKVA